MGPAPRLRHSCLVLTAAFALAMGPASADTRAPAFASFGATAEAAGILFKVTYSGFASLFPIVDIGLGHVSGAVDSRPNARGYAAAADPGQAIQSLGAVGVPMPAYPYMARAEYPGTTPRARSSASEQTVGPGAADALTSEVWASDGPTVDSLARVASFDAPGIVTTGAVFAHTSLRVDGLVRARTEVTVKDVLIGDVLGIRAVRTVVESSAGGSPGSATGDPRIELSGVTLAGQAATIDEDGVHLSGREAPGSSGGVVAPLGDLLAAGGFAVRLGEVRLTASPDGTSAVGGAEGLLVSYTAPDGSVAEYRLGWAAQTVGAVLTDEPAMSYGTPEGAYPSGGSLPPAGPAAAPATGAVPLAPGAIRAAAVGLPAGTVALVALGQLALLAAMAGAAWQARSEARGLRREWLFDTVDRLRPSHPS